MDLYNQDLEHVGKADERYSELLNNQVQFALNLLGNQEKFSNIIKNRLNHIVLVECDISKGDYYHVLYEGKLHKFKFSDSAGAFVTFAKQARNENGWKMTTGVHIRKRAYDMNNPKTYKSTLPHENFHAISDKVEINFDEDGYCCTKSGFIVTKYDLQDKEVYTGLKAVLLTEGTTEMLANIFNNTSTQQDGYSFGVFIARILSYAKMKPSLLETYFSNDENDVVMFFDNFNKSQSHITAKDLIEAPVGVLFWLEDNCLKIIKACLQYTVNSLNSIEELKYFYNEIREITLSIADCIKVNIGEERRNQVVDFVRENLTELLDIRKEEITNKNITHRLS